jgi:hypothetical protein
MPNFPNETWLLQIGETPCNIYTGPDGENAIKESSTSAEGPRATVMFKCLWEDRNDLKAGLLGTVDYQGGSIIRTSPFAYPVSEDDTVVTGGLAGPPQVGLFPGRLFCTDVSDISGVKWVCDSDGSITGLAGWGYYYYAILAAQFTAPPYLQTLSFLNGVAFRDLMAETYCVSKIRVSGEVFSPPTGSYLWVEGGRKGKQVQDAHCGLTRPRYELSVTRVRMPMVPMAVMDSLIGTVNETTLQVGSNTVSPDAALFMGYNVEPRSDPYSGGIVFDIELLWLLNGYITSRGADGSWNWFVDPLGDWSGIASASSDATEPPFDEAEHNVLFSDTIG